MQIYKIYFIKTMIFIILISVQITHYNGKKPEIKM